MSAWLYKEVFCSGDKRHYNIMGQYGSWFRRELFHWSVLNPAIPSLGSLRSWWFVSVGERGKKAEKTRSNERRGKQLRRLHIRGFYVATGPGMFFSCNMHSPKVKKDLKWGCIMSRDLNWTIMILIFFSSCLQTRTGVSLSRFSGRDWRQAQGEWGARDTRDGEAGKRL